MKRSVLIFLLAHSTVSLLQSQTGIIQVKPMDSKAWKYADIRGNVIINCEYPVIYPFSEDGIAVVNYPKKNLYLLINSKGEEINTEVKGFMLKDVFGYGAKGYSDGLITIRLGKKWGCLNTLGSIAVPLKYDNLSVFTNGYGIGRIEKKFFIVNAKGKETAVDEKNITDVKQFKENLAQFVTEDDLQGFLDTTAAIIIPARFPDVGYFYNGIAWAKNVDGLIGYINVRGEWIIQPQFKAARDFDKESGLARVKKDDTWLYVNANGETVSFAISEITDDFCEGLARGKTTYYFGFYDNKGNWVIQPQFENVRDFRNGYAAAKANGLWGIIDRAGNWVIKPTFAGIKDVEIIQEGQ